MKLPDGTEMDVVGDTDPKLMPEHLFPGALFIDHENARGS